MAVGRKVRLRGLEIQRAHSPISGRASSEDALGNDNVQIPLAIASLALAVAATVALLAALLVDIRTGAAAFRAEVAGQPNRGDDRRGVRGVVVAAIG